MEAEFVRGDEKNVTIKRGTKEFTLALDKVSEADREYVSSKLAAAKHMDTSELGDYAKYAAAGWVKGEEEKLPFQIHAPKSFERDQPVPLVIFLHGVGERGTDNEKQVNILPKTFVSAKNQDKRPCIIIAPQCPPDQFWPDLPGEIIALTKNIAKHMPVDSHRIYLSGYSMGGYGVWSVLAVDSKLYAAAIPISGGGNPQNAAKMKDIPIWNFHGDADTTVKVLGSRDMVEALKKVKANITYTEMAGQGHGISTKVIGDEKVQEWLFSQKR
jgi:predicted peptidase